MSTSDFTKQLEEAQARFAACSEPKERFKLGLAWLDLLLGGGRFLEASEAAGILKPLASDQAEQARVFQRAGRAYLRLSDYVKARYHLNEALSRLGDDPASGDLSLVYHDIAWMHYRQGYLDEARSYAEDAELALGSQGAKPGPEYAAGQAECHHLFSLIESATGSYESAVDRLSKEIKIRLAGGDEQRLAAAYNKLSSVLQTSGDVMKAMEHQRHSMELAEKAGNIYRKSISLKNFGEMHFIMGDLDQAWKCHSESLLYSVQAGNHLGFVFNHAGLGRIYRARGSAVSAMSEYRQALDAARRINFLDRESSILADVADLLCERGELVRAQEQLDRARTLDSERGQDPSPWHALVSARVAAAGGRPEGFKEGLRLTERMLSGPIIIDDEEFITIPELTMGALMLKGEVEKRQGREEKARESFLKAKALAEDFSREFTKEQREMFRKRREIAAVYQAAGS